MIANRSMPSSTVIPVLTCPDLEATIAWLGAAFGFTVRLRIANHRAQLNVGDGHIVLAAQSTPDGATPPSRDTVMIRVDDVDALHRRAFAAGARVLQPPTDFPYGERQCSVADLTGRVWSFSQSIGDVAPETWGGSSANL